MKKIIVCICICLPIRLFSQDDVKEIKAVLESQIFYWNKGDLVNFMNGYWNNDSLMFIGKTGVTYGFQHTLQRYQKNYPDQNTRGILSFDIIQVKYLSPDYYWVLGKWNLKRNNGDAMGHYTLLFRKIKGKWKIIADHSS